MLTKLDTEDPESIHRFFHQTNPDAASDRITQAITFGWFLLPKNQRTEENLERQVRQLVDDALRDFKEDNDRFLAPKEDFSNPSDIALGRDLLLKVGSERFGPSDDLIRERLEGVIDDERLERLFQKLYSASSWDDLVAEV
jgi:hypothetical protein